MTREEAVGKINAIKKYLTAGNPIWDVREIDEALNMAIKALEQEPVKHGEWEKNEPLLIVKEFENVFQDRRAISLDEVKSTIRGLFE